MWWQPTVDPTDLGDGGWVASHFQSDGMLLLGRTKLRTGRWGSGDVQLCSSTGGWVLRAYRLRGLHHVWQLHGSFVSHLGVLHQAVHGTSDGLFTGPDDGRGWWASLVLGA